MPRDIFWQGLKPTLKDISGYTFQKITDFDKLKVEIKKLELGHLNIESSVRPNQSQGQRFNRESHQNRYQPPYQRKGQGPLVNETDQQYQCQGQSYRSNQGQGNFKPYKSEDFNRGPLCFRCRQYGYYQWRCLRMDHSRAHLNWNKPMDRDFP